MNRRPYTELCAVAREMRDWPTLRSETWPERIESAARDLAAARDDARLDHAVAVRMAEFNANAIQRARDVAYGRGLVAGRREAVAAAERESAQPWLFWLGLSLTAVMPFVGLLLCVLAA